MMIIIWLVHIHFFSAKAVPLGGDRWTVNFPVMVLEKGEQRCYLEPKGNPYLSSEEQTWGGGGCSRTRDT